MTWLDWAGDLEFWASGLNLWLMKTAELHLEMGLLVLNFTYDHFSSTQLVSTIWHELCVKFDYITPIFTRVGFDLGKNDPGFHGFSKWLVFLKFISYIRSFASIDFDLYCSTSVFLIEKESNISVFQEYFTF